MIPREQSKGFLGPIGKLIDVIDTPRAAIVSAVKEIGDLAQGEGFSARDWWNQTADNMFFGEVLDDWDLKTGNKFLDFGIGFLGDVALDPLTYLGGASLFARGAKAQDIAVSLRAAGSAAHKAGDVQKARMLTEAATQVAAKRSVSAASDDALRAIGMDIGIRTTVPMTGRVGRTLIEKPLNAASGGRLSAALDARRATQVPKYIKDLQITASPQRIQQAMTALRRGDDAFFRGISDVGERVMLTTAARAGKSMPVQSKRFLGVVPQSIAKNGVLPWGKGAIRAVFPAPGRLMRATTQRGLIQSMDQAINSKAPIRAFFNSDNPDVILHGLDILKANNIRVRVASQFKTQVNEPLEQIAIMAQRMGIGGEDINSMSSMPLFQQVPLPTGGTLATRKLNPNLPQSILDLGDEAAEELYMGVRKFYETARTQFDQLGINFEGYVDDIYAARFLSEKGRQVVFNGKTGTVKIPLGGSASSMNARHYLSPDDFANRFNDWVIKQQTKAGVLNPTGVQGLADAELSRLEQSFRGLGFSDGFMGTKFGSVRGTGRSIVDQMHDIGQKTMGERYVGMFDDDFFSIGPRYLRSMSDEAGRLAMINDLADAGVLFRSPEVLHGQAVGRLEEALVISKNVSGEAADAATVARVKAARQAAWADEAVDSTSAHLLDLETESLMLGATASRLLKEADAAHTSVVRHLTPIKEAFEPLVHRATEIAKRLHEIDALSDALTALNKRVHAGSTGTSDVIAHSLKQELANVEAALTTVQQQLKGLGGLDETVQAFEDVLKVFKGHDPSITAHRSIKDWASKVKEIEQISAERLVGSEDFSGIRQWVDGVESVQVQKEIDELTAQFDVLKNGVEYDVPVLKVQLKKAEASIAANSGETTVRAKGAIARGFADELIESPVAGLEGVMKPAGKGATVTIKTEAQAVKLKQFLDDAYDQAVAAGLEAEAKHLQNMIDTTVGAFTRRASSLSSAQDDLARVTADLTAAANPPKPNASLNRALNKEARARFGPLDRTTGRRTYTEAQAKNPLVGSGPNKGQPKVPLKPNQRLTPTIDRGFDPTINPKSGRSWDDHAAALRRKRDKQGNWLESEGQFQDRVSSYASDKTTKTWMAEQRRIRATNRAHPDGEVGARAAKQVVDNMIATEMETELRILERMRNIDTEIAGLDANAARALKEQVAVERKISQVRRLAEEAAQSDRLTTRLTALDDHHQAIQAFNDHRMLRGFQEAYTLELSSEWGMSGFRHAGGEELDGLMKDVFNSMYRVNNEEALGAFFQKYDKFMSWWKAQAIASPGGFATRNFMGGIWVNTQIAGVEMGQHSKAWQMYKSALAAGDGDFLRGAQMMADAGQGTRLKASWGRPTFRNASAEDWRMFNEMSQAGLGRGGQVTGEIEMSFDSFRKMKRVDVNGRTRTVGRLDPRSSEFVPLFQLRNANEQVEFMLRTGLGMDIMQKGGTLDEAFSAVTKYHFDYTPSALTMTERRFRRMIPFWRWQKNILPVLVESLGRRPTAWSRLSQLKGELELQSDSDGVVPDYFMESWGVRLPFKSQESQVYYIPDLPFRDLMKYTKEPTSPVRAFAESAAPPLKVPLELWAGKQIFADLPFTGRFQQVPSVYDNVPFLMDAIALAGKAEKSRNGTWTMRDHDLHIFDQFMPMLGRFRRLVPNEDRYQGRVVTTWVSNVFGTSLRVNDVHERLNQLSQEEQSWDSMWRDIGDVELRRR